MRGLLAAAVVLLGLVTLSGLLVVFVFNFLTLRPDRVYSPGLYGSMVVNLLTMLAVVVLVYILLRRLWR